MDFDKEEFANVFGFKPTVEMAEYLEALMAVEYDNGYADGCADTDNYEQGYDEGYKDGVEDATEGVEGD